MQVFATHLVLIMFLIDIADFNADALLHIWFY